MNNGNTITAYIYPFDLYQRVSVYNEYSECIATTKCSINDVDLNIATLAKAFNANKIILFGNGRQYMYKIEEQLTTKYNLNDLEIVIYGED